MANTIATLISFFWLLIACNYLDTVQGQSTGSLRLVSYYGTTGGSAGRLEIYYSGRWGTVCDDSFGQTDANVACRQLGYSRASRYGSVGYLGYSRASSSVPIWLDNLRCYSSDTSLLSCRHNGVGNHNCGHSEDVAIVCTGTSSGSSGSSSSGVDVVLIGGSAGGVLGTLLIIFIVCSCFFAIFNTCCDILKCQRRSTHSRVLPQSNVMLSPPPPAVTQTTMMNTTGQMAGTSFSLNQYPQQQPAPNSVYPQHPKQNVVPYASAVPEKSSLYPNSPPPPYGQGPGSSAAYPPPAVVVPIGEVQTGSPSGAQSSIPTSTVPDATNSKPQDATGTSLWQPPSIG